jgi:hypothetical protein
VPALVPVFTYGLGRRYLYLGGAHSEFPEISFNETLARVEGPLNELGDSVAHALPRPASTLSLVDALAATRCDQRRSVSRKVSTRHAGVRAPHRQIRVEVRAFVTPPLTERQAEISFGGRPCTHGLRRMAQSLKLLPLPRHPEGIYNAVRSCQINLPRT